MQQHHSDSNLFALLDQCRQELGKHLDALGFGPVETPSRAVVSKPGITLKSYESAATCNGLQSKHAGPAISAFFGPN